MPRRFYEISFECVEDAAAFVAALSRQVASPVAEQAFDLAPRAYFAHVDGRPRIFLCDRALLVAQRAFGQVPGVPIDSFDARDYSGLGEVDLAHPTGLEEVMQRLASLDRQARRA